MVDARIELVEHPRGIGLRHEVAGALDEIVEVERAACVFQSGVAERYPRQEKRQCRGAFDGNGSALLVAQVDEALLFVQKARQHRWIERLDRLGDDGSLLGPAGIAILSEEDGQIDLNLSRGVLNRQGLAEGLRQLHVIG